jgi:hypothetical protein
MVSYGMYTCTYMYMYMYCANVCKYKCTHVANVRVQLYTCTCTCTCSWYTYMYVAHGMLQLESKLHVAVRLPGICLHLCAVYQKLCICSHACQHAHPRVCTRTLVGDAFLLCSGWAITASLICKVHGSLFQPVITHEARVPHTSYIHCSLF